MGSREEPGLRVPRAESPPRGRRPLLWGPGNGSSPSLSWGRHLLWPRALGPYPGVQLRPQRPSPGRAESWPSPVSLGTGEQQMGEGACHLGPSVPG